MTQHLLSLAPAPGALWLSYELNGTPSSGPGGLRLVRGVATSVPRRPGPHRP